MKELTSILPSKIITCNYDVIDFFLQHLETVYRYVGRPQYNVPAVHIIAHTITSKLIEATAIVQY